MLEFLNDLLWGKVLIVVLIFIGLFFTIRSNFVQFRYFGRMFSVLTNSFETEAGQLSSFQALVLSVAGRVGAGNIAGVAVAISLGGPGAVFWMWVIALIGMATSFFECTIAQVFKHTQPDGTFRGGPAYYMERALGQRWLGSLFSFLLLVTFGFGFNAVQSYTVATSIQDTFGIPTKITGFVLMVILGLVIFGGIKRIAQIAEFVVPIMAGGYFLMTVYVLIRNITEVPGAIAFIIRSAFGLEQAIAGGLGVALIYGIKRGLFSNEAGLGSAPNVAAVAYVRHPVDQGIIQSFSVFIDTIIMCTCTATVILLSSVYQPGDTTGGILLSQSAMAEHVGGWGRAFMSIALLLFAFTSIIYNYYLGENSLNFFSEGNKLIFNAFRILTLVLIIWGAVQDLSTVFGFADITMGLLALVNIYALFKLANVGLKVMRDFDRQVKNGVKQPVFNISKFPDLNLDSKAWKKSPEELEPLAIR
ncbi:sodium:alanine symporter family protein [Gloeocapsa sp. PCC 73106]|uniref:alanine/glycine:cation symporter family protein n=1 Tax=Gloeocapsa sp. PCC 73106 TaxID=102232 RepID=UPI0002AC32BE|nr:alanine/glycine:cation symporter family protein [Gloeocapsa sp. PCC 73106]ELR97731.1 amino acid carrier protein [Gloeocapsa sp. PCC 73106]